MSIGEYKQKVSFVSYTSVEDSYGGTTDTSTIVLTTFCKVSPLRGARALSFAQIGLYGVSQFDIRWRENFTPTEKMKIDFRGQLYTIHEAIEVNAAERFWQITAYTKQ